MKKPLLISASLLTLGVVTGIYAQSVGATSSIVDKMKAVAHSFTLTTSLNPTDTGLTSDPVKGKKTGDILTAGEWNRMLELVGEGGGGGGSSKMVMSEMSPTAYTNLVDAVNYCRNLTENGITNWKFPTYGDLVNFIDPKYSQDMVWVADFDVSVGASTYIIKDYFASMRLSDGYWSVSNAADGAGKVRCVAQTGGSTAGAGSQVSSRAAAVRASGHPLAIPSGITDWPDAIVCDGYGGWAGGTQTLTLDLTGNNVVGYTQAEGIGVFFDPSTGVLGRADRVGSCGATNIAAICAAGRCTYSSSASVASSSWVDVPLTDTADYDKTCEYRYSLSLLSAPNTAWMSDTSAYYYPMGVSSKYLSGLFSGTTLYGVRSSNKNQYGYKDTAGVFTHTTEVNVTKMQKRCN